MFQNDLQSLACLRTQKSFCVTPENLTGEKGGACKATEGTGAKEARNLGIGWKISPSVEIKAGSTFVLAQGNGEGAIQSMWFGGVVSREYLLRFYWDGEEIPSVECPMPDFFAYGWAHATCEPWNNGPFPTLNSLPVVVAPIRGFNAFWYMPFCKGFKITLENTSNTTMVCYYQINYSLHKLQEKAGHFHAYYYASTPLQRGEVHTVLPRIHAKGQYIGTALSVGLNADDRWWGEGELKFYLDGDQEYPTICTTGTEDYFGGSFNWEVDHAYVPYSTPYMGMHYYAKPDGLYVIQPRFSMYRWHIVDPISFESDIHIILQDLGWKPFEDGREYLPRRDDFHSVAFWYQEMR